MFANCKCDKQQQKWKNGKQNVIIAKRMRLMIRVHLLYIEYERQKQCSPNIC